MGELFKRFLFGFFAVVSSLPAQAYYEFSETTNFSYEKLVALIDAKGINTVEAALEQAKNYYPEFFDNYILMYHSRSLQGSSFEAPRALLFDRSGKFVFSFNGQKKQRGYDRLEIMQFREDTFRFEFREITFREGEKPRFSEANPSKCMVCHQDIGRKNIDPRPNWEPYNTWPGAFGSVSGRLLPSKYDRDELAQKGASLDMLNDMALEETKLIEFFQNVQPNHSRYKFLNKEKYLNRRGEYEPRVTVEFTEILSRLNFQRIVRILTQDMRDAYQYLEYPLMGVAKCGQLQVPPEELDWFRENWGTKEVIYKYESPSKKESIGHLRRELLQDRETSQLPQEEFDKIVNEVYAKRVNENEKYLEVEISNGLHHLFEPLGISTADWSMDFKTDGRLAFRERFGTPSNPRDNLRNAFKKVTGRSYKGEHLSCAEIGKKSEQAIRDLKKSQLFQKLMVEKKEREIQLNAPLVQRCMKCHQSDDPSIPSIAFNNPEKLKEQLLKPAMYSSRTLINEVKYRLGDYAKEEERMPLGPPVSNQQRHDLINYLKDLIEE